MWKDDEGGVTGNVLLDMANAVQNAGLMIVCASEPYCISECCRLELEYGHQMKKEMILIRLDPNLNFSGKGSVGLILGSKLYIQFDGNETKLFNEVLKSIHQKLGNLPPEINTPKPSTAKSESPSLTVVSNQKPTEYVGRYTYIGEYNGAPHYSQDNGSGYLYRNNKGNDNWHFRKDLGSMYADFWSPKTDCPSYSRQWQTYDYQQKQWVVFPGFTVSVN